MFTLANNCLEVCKKIKYLGHCIADDMNDDDDIYRQCYKLYAQANTIARKFSYCSTRVKVALFKCLLYITLYNPSVVFLQKI